jgi:aryl-alcohol dehydrogenase-like predicted oxidoreductase
VRFGRGGLRPGGRVARVLPRSFVTLGTMNFGGRTSKEESVRIVHRAIERGVTFFDTANVYGDGASEQILGEALRGSGARRDEVGIATKVGLKRRSRGKPEGLSAEVVKAALEESLGHLGTDYVDVYYLHAPDPSTPLEETLGAIQELIASGKVRAFGVSNFAAWQIAELNQLCDGRGMSRPVMSQVLYNLLVRQIDIEYLAFARAHPLHTTVYNPLAGGLLAREVKPGDPIPTGSRFEKNKLYRGRYWSEALLQLAARYGALANEAGLSLCRLAYAWIAARRQNGVTSVLAGPGAIEHLDAALESTSVPLAPELLARIDQIHRDFTGTDVSYAR